MQFTHRDQQPLLHPSFHNTRSTDTLPPPATATHPSPSPLHHLLTPPLPNTPLTRHSPTQNNEGELQVICRSACLATPAGILYLHPPSFPPLPQLYTLFLKLYFLSYTTSLNFILLIFFYSLSHCHIYKKKALNSFNTFVFWSVFFWHFKWFSLCLFPHFINSFNTLLYLKLKHCSVESLLFSYFF